MHSLGYTYNDLKPDNIMLNNSSNGQVHVTLIDFGFAKQIKEFTNSDEEVDYFEGNIMFASIDKL